MSDYNFENTPLTVILSLILILQFFSKRKEISTTNLSPEENVIYGSLFYRYLALFSLSKLPDWVFGPFYFDFFQKYHDFSLPFISKMRLVSYISSMILGPTVLGYFSDNLKKKTNILIMNATAILFSTVLMFKNSIGLAICGQVLYGALSCLLTNSFQSWLINEVDANFKDEIKRKMILSAIFEKFVSDSDPLW